MAFQELEVRYATKRATDCRLADGEGLHLLVRPGALVYLDRLPPTSA